ncbi:Hydroxyacylglutathione hydrolase [Planctomycetes bacterium Poly30]|uniref:Hydroxyacylglutathione hydrolase n=1 Tax=Saltatorellus ferox TaxID=2528018 RepID=A0A518ER30_9BACT|nr:Hydroxyacylglutathione hydrolase [Planctomycetes bacterium Poly30]
MTLLVDTAAGADGLVVQRCQLWGYNAIGVVSGDEAIAVDPGITPEEIASFRAALLANGARRVTHVVITHSHHDHIRGWDAFEGATIVAPSAVASKPADSRARILAGKAKVDERMGVADSSFEYPSVDVTFGEAHELRVGHLSLLLRSLPGHSDCSSVVVIPKLRTLLSADYLVSPGLPYCRWEPAPFERANERLSEFIEEFDIDRVVPAHNDLLESRGAALSAIEEELSYFRFLRTEVRRQMALGVTGHRLLHACAAAMTERRGVDLGRKAHQDADNARRVQKELME